MNADQFGRQLLYVEILVRFQRALRIIVRAVWLAMGAYLVAWSLNSLFGWLSDPRLWIRCASIVGMLTLAWTIFPWHNRKRFTWRLDRRLGGKEQISTAWQVLSAGDTGPIANALVLDASDLLGSFRNRILRRGWHLLPDLLSGMVLAVLLALVTSTAPVSYEIPREIGSMPLPPFVAEPSFKEVFPEGNAGLQKLADYVDRNEPAQTSDQAISPTEEALSADAYQTVAEALFELGKELSNNAATYDIGEALMNMEIEQAASAMEDLSTSAAQLSPGTLEDLAESLQEAAEKLDQPESQTLMPNLQEAASAIANDDPSENGSPVQDSLGKVAGDLRELAGMMKSQAEGDVGAPGADPSDEGRSAGGGIGAGLSTASESGPAEHFERLIGEGGMIELENLTESMRIALRPGNPSQNLRPGTSSGSRSSVVGSSNDLIEANLVPYRYPWKWRDVVSKYFSP
jgi:hypothetical protein